MLFFITAMKLLIFFKTFADFLNNCKLICIFAPINDGHS